MAASASDDDRERLLARLGVQISPELLDLALTHRSYAYENGGVPTNERLEFLGDSILGKAITVWLYREYPELSEGELAKRRASLVSAVALAEVAEAIGLGEYIMLGKGEEQTGGRSKGSILADTVEALFGAAFLSGGGELANDFVLRMILPLVENPTRFGASMDSKTSLQELSSRRGHGLPVYRVTDTGPDHGKVFQATVSVGGRDVATGIGSSKKQAEMAAALEAWSLLSAETDPDQTDPGQTTPER